MTELILSIDQGTTGSTVLIFTPELDLVAKGYKEFPQIYPQPGWVEHDPEEIWKSVTDAIQKAVDACPIPAHRITAVGITNQRETSLVWNKETGKAYHNAIVWQCRRTAPTTDDLKNKGYENLFRKKTGLVLDPYFTGTKLAWMFENVNGLMAEADAGRVAAGTIDTFLVWRLTGGQAHVTDATNASRTLLMDLHSHTWDSELCNILHVPQNVLPEICGCAQVYGKTCGIPGLPDGIPVCGMAGDQQSALFGQACFTPGEAKCTYGTGAFLLMNTGESPVESKHGLLTTVAWKIKDTTAYALEGSAFIAGAAVQWLRDGLKLIENADQIEDLAASVEDTGGVTLVPAFVGLSAPHWRADARGIITGLTRGTTAAHIARATLEGIALQNVEILKAMETDGQTQLPKLKVDGGASANNLLMQMQADFLGRDIVRPVLLETTALGAAFLAGLGAGIFADTDDIANTWKKDRVFTPAMDDEKRSQILTQWANAVKKA